MFERPERGECAVLVHVGTGRSSPPEEQQEFEALALAAGAEVAAGLSAPLRVKNPRYLIGTGKLAELKSLVNATAAELVLVDHHLSAAQERNLEKELERRVVDRAGLILDIFAQRARTFEGKLQVELAQLEHLSTRLVRGWSHLERQKGGIGLRGPGETQLETDRRLLAKRIRQLQERLHRVARHRDLSRQQRRRHEVPVVSLVGYTNAGKSTLFNRLTDAGAVVADQLFATLDPTLRSVGLPDGRRIVIADTVGFIRDLPHELIAAFHSTLEETREARLLLHVVDAADSAHAERIEQVEQVLAQIGAASLPMIRVFNKADILQTQPRVDRTDTGMPSRVWLSAATGAGIGLLMDSIAEYLHRDVVRGMVRLTAAEARLRAAIYRHAGVRSERLLEDGGWEIDLEMDRAEFLDLQRSDGVRLVPVHEQAGGASSLAGRSGRPAWRCF
ncbi:MAG: GTPase HflX [Gammaproteobacteria bacterium]|nr:MAG: GTPase HflX [Gammaproteobacteria bacterium]